MTKSEIRKIRKRIDSGLSNIKYIYGCYVDAAGDLIAKMRIPVLDMEMEEREMYAALLRKGMSGPKEKHIMELELDTSKVEDSDEHRLLMTLAESGLEDEESRKAFYEKVAASLVIPGKGYTILLASDTFDIQSRFDDDEEWSEESETSFTYFICSICEVKDSKAMLKYLSKPKEFRGASTGSILAAPILGFMFPVFEEGCANIYRTMFYSRNASDNHEEFIRSIFPVKTAPLSSDMQREAFNTALSQSLGDDCSIDVVTSIQTKIASTLCDKGTECSIVTPEITTGEVSEILRDKGISETKIDAFEKAVEDSFGTDKVATVNLMQKDTFEISSSEAQVIVSPDNVARIKTKVIDGVRYFLVPVGADVKINGVEVVLEEN